MTTLTAIPVVRATSAVRPLTRKRMRSWRRVLVAAFAVVGAVAIGAGVYEKVGHAAPLRAEVIPAARAVTVTSPAVADAGAELILPAQTLPNEQTMLYPRIDGYVAKWHADRGARVVAGQLLADIDAPELDQQARQAAAALDRGRAAVGQLKADRDQAEAEADAAKAQIQLAEADTALANQELERIAATIRAGAASRTDYDTAVRNRDASAARVAVTKADASAKVKLIASRDAAIVTQEANVRGLEADLARLKELQKFKRVVAPFAGTVTRRQAEVGMLVTAAGGSPLFHVQDSSVLRVQVDVPQRYAVAARRATEAQVLVPELPGRPLAAKVARTADTLDPTTRTLRVELDLPNPDGAVLAGTFTRVRFHVPSDRPVITVPVGVLRYTPEGVQVAVVSGDTVELRAVTLGRDYGRSVEVTTGLTGAERLVVNPADDLRNGETVRLVGERPADERATALAASWPAAVK
jgi:membrane fusion protein (multidrug efflux system)